MMPTAANWSQHSWHKLLISIVIGFRVNVSAVNRHNKMLIIRSWLLESVEADCWKVHLGEWVTFMGILPPPSHHLHPTSHALLMQNFCNTLWSRWWLVVVTMQLKTCNFQHFCKLIVFMKMLIFIGFMRYLKTKLQHVHVAILIC